MAIDYRRLRSLTARELIGALMRDEFCFVRQTGSHQRYRHDDGWRVTVAPHGGGDTFSVKTLQRIIEEQACWTEHDLRRLPAGRLTIGRRLVNLPHGNRWAREESDGL